VKVKLSACLTLFKTDANLRECVWNGVFGLLSKTSKPKKVNIEVGGDRMSKKLVIFVCALCLVSGVAQAANALWNGDFELGTLEGWWTYLGDTANATVAVTAGGPGASVYDVSIYTNSPNPGPELGQDIAFAAGLTPTVSLMYDAPAGQWAGISVTVQYKDSAWTYIDSGWDVFYQGSGAGDTGWVTYDSTGSGTKGGNWVAPAGTAHLTFKITQWGWQPAGTVIQYDNVSVTPEPATMVLLGIGGLLALRRKHA
jgi:hypothetical protein